MQRERVRGVELLMRRRRCGMGCGCRRQGDRRGERPSSVVVCLAAGEDLERAEGSCQE